MSIVSFERNSFVRKKGKRTIYRVEKVYTGAQVGTFDLLNSETGEEEKGVHRSVLVPFLIPVTPPRQTGFE